LVPPVLSVPIPREIEGMLVAFTMVTRISGVGVGVAEA
jgi:hypothetical protein